jgi:ubiquinone/menaquinone biosynthesis C-methylase UbiE
MAEQHGPPPQWGAVFDALSSRYDQSGVPFFGPIARALADRLAVSSGERVLELGCGRGALTLLLAEAVGAEGRVDALDLSGEMVALTRAVTEGLSQVSVAQGDAADPSATGAPYDVVAASLVLFFLPDPTAAVRRWRALVRPGARAGVTTFAAPTPSWRAMEAAFDEALGQPVSQGPYGGPFADDEGVEAVFRAAAWADVRTEVSVHDVPFRDLAQWEEYVDGTALRGLWAQLDDAGRARVRSRVADLLDADGGRLQIAVRHTLARA